MTTAPRVLGILMARNEWPLLGLSIVHAVPRHVDHLVVLDHGSADDTCTGLADLAGRWPDRITRLRSDDPAFLQEAATALLASVGHASDFDWVYVFDADEFILPAEGKSLREVLAAIPDDVDVVRYDIINFLAPYGLDDLVAEQYAEVRFRAQPNVFVDACPVLADEIMMGNVTFFDLPFPGKVIYRGRVAGWAGAGSHYVRTASETREEHLPPSELRAGHLPLLSRRRLEQKADQGRALIDAGFPSMHGWQSQILHRLQDAGLLDDFWRLHSAPDAAESGREHTATLVPDDGLRTALLSAKASLESPQLGQSAAEAATSVSLGDAIRAVRMVQQSCDEGLAKAGAELAQTRAELVQTRAELAKARSQSDELARSVTTLTETIQTRDEELALGRAHLEEVFRSTSWRATRPLRDLTGMLARGRGRSK